MADEDGHYSFALALWCGGRGYDPVRSQATDCDFARRSRKHVDELCQLWHNSVMKEVRWHGSSRSDVEAFPADAWRLSALVFARSGSVRHRARIASSIWRPSAMLFTSCTRSRKRHKQRPSAISTSPGHGSDRSG